MWFVRAATLVRTVGRHGLVLLFALRHPATPRGLKLAILALFAYVISPIDLIPDFAALFGVADDAALLLVGIPLLVRRLPSQVLQDVQQQVARLLARFGIGSESDPRSAR